MTKADKEGQREAPILRFKGFTDAWEQRKLKQLGNIKRGASPRPISDPKWFDKNGKYGWLRISDVTSQNGQVFQIDQHLSSIGEEKTILISDPHLIISIAATVGKPCINYIPTAIHDGFVTFLDYKFNLDFMFEWFNKNQNIWLKYGQPGAQINLNSSIIGNQKIKLPKAYEQEKIAKLFDILNNLLALYDRKLKLLSQVKRYFLDNLFAEKEYPNLRFRRFTDAWEQRELGEIGTTYSGLSGKNKSNFEKGNSNFVTFLEVLNNPVLKNIDLANKVEIKENEHQNKIRRNDILFNTSSETPEEVATSTIVDINQDNLYLNSFCFGFRPNVQFSNYCIGYYLRSNHFRSKVFCLAQGISRYNISKKSLMKLKLSLPKLEEQDKIGKIFNQIELLLTLYENKQQHLIEIKNTLLNTMFI